MAKRAFVVFGDIYKSYYYCLFFFISTIGPIKKVNFVTNHKPDFYASQLSQLSPSPPCWPRFLSRVKRLETTMILPSLQNEAEYPPFWTSELVRCIPAWIWRQCFVFHDLFRRQPVHLWPLVEEASVWQLF